MFIFPGAERSGPFQDPEENSDRRAQTVRDRADSLVLRKENQVPAADAPRQTHPDHQRVPQNGGRKLFHFS